MSQRLGTMRQQGSGLSVTAYEGFSWPAFLFGPLWYFAKGMPGMGIVLFLLAVPSFGIAWIIGGFLGNKQHREHLAARGYQMTTDSN
jgi:hypothetical protein